MEWQPIETVTIFVLILFLLLKNLIDCKIIKNRLQDIRLSLDVIERNSFEVKIMAMEKSIQARCKEIVDERISTEKFSVLYSGANQNDVDGFLPRDKKGKWEVSVYCIDSGFQYFDINQPNLLSILKDILKDDYFQIAICRKL